MFCIFKFQPLKSHLRMIRKLRNKPKINVVFIIVLFLMNNILNKRQQNNCLNVALNDRLVFFFVVFLVLQKPHDGSRSAHQPQTHRCVFIWTRSGELELVVWSYFGSYETHFWVNVAEEVTAVPHLLSVFYGSIFCALDERNKYIFLFNPCWTHLERLLYSDHTIVLAMH